MPGTVNRRGGTPTHRPSRAPAGAHRPRSLFELQDVGSVATNAVKPHPCPRFHLACRRYRWLAAAPSSYRPARCGKCPYKRGKTALVQPLPSCFRTALGACPKGDSRRRSPTCPPTRSLRARPSVGGRLEPCGGAWEGPGPRGAPIAPLVPGPSNPAACRGAIPRRGGPPRLSVRPLHGGHGQPAPAELRLLGGHGPRPHSILWHSTSAVTTHLDMLTARSGGGAGRSGAARRGSRFRPRRPRTR